MVQTELSQSNSNGFVKRTLDGENAIPYEGVNSNASASSQPNSRASSADTGSNAILNAEPDSKQLKPNVAPDYKLTSTPRILLIATLALLVLRVGLSIYEFKNPAATNPGVHWQDAGTLGGNTEPGLIKAANKKFIIYEFYADWCSPCQRLEHDVLTNNEIRDLMEKNFVCIRVSDRQREDGKNSKLVTDLQKRHRVFAFPTLVIVGPDSETKGQLVGNSSSLAVYRFLSRTLVKPGA